MKYFIKKFIPYMVKIKYKEYQRNKLKLKIIKYLERYSQCEDYEKNEIANYLKNNKLSVFPYNFTKKYNPQNIIVYDDENSDMKYVLHENKRLYFKKKWNEQAIKNYYNGLLIEQDIDSPHRYETEKFHVCENDVVVDVGVAEGNFAISVVEKVKKIYLFEVDEEWIEALKMTFAPWKEKVIIVAKYVSDSSNDNCIKLDDFFKTEKIDFLKADIEGAEMQLLKGIQTILSTNNPIKIVICTYHKQNDAEDIKCLLMENGFNIEFSKGYMIFRDKNIHPPYIRKGLILSSR